MTDKAPLLRFGVIADPQYADADPWIEQNRYYRQSLGKLDKAVAALNHEDLSFVVTLGDLIDRDWKSFDLVLEHYKALRHERIFLPGNHDFSVAPDLKHAVHDRLGMPAPWHDFQRGGIRFVVLDGNEISLFSTPQGHPHRAAAQSRLDALVGQGALNAKPWNGGIGDAQFQWLEETLANAKVAGEKAIVMAHYPLFPENEHNLWGGEKLVELFEKSGNVIAYLNGHNHAGNVGHHGSTWYVNFKGMVDTPTENAFATVSVYADRLEITGYGREENRTLAF